MPFVDAEGARLFYRAEGPEDAPVLLLSNSLGTDLGMWDPQRRLMRAPCPEGYVACCAAVRDMDQRASLEGITAPTLVIAGRHDQATPPEQGRLIADGIGGARFVELDAAHISNIEAEAAFTARRARLPAGVRRPRWTSETATRPA